MSIDDNQTILLIITLSTNGLSIFGSFFMIVCYFKFKDIQSFAFKLVLYLNISDFILGLGYMVDLVRLVNTDDTVACQIQAGILNFGALSALIWTAIIAYTLYQSVINGRNETYLSENLFLFFGFGVPFLMSIYPYLTDDYGLQQGTITCWFEDNQDKRTKSLLLRLYNFYLPLYLIILFNLAVYIRVAINHKTLRLVEKDQEHGFINKLIMYPLILIICWIWGTINGIFYYFTESLFWLTALQAFFGGLQGFLNSIAYGFTSQVKDNLSGCCPCYRRQKVQDADSAVSQSLELKQATVDSSKLSHSQQSSSIESSSQESVFFGMSQTAGSLDTVLE